MADSFEAVEDPGDGIAARFEFDPATDDVVVAVVEAVESTTAGEVLNDAIDPDALRRFLESGGPETCVFFEFCGHSVTAGEGEILLSR
jgi:hypothetical protein